MLFVILLSFVISSFKKEMKQVEVPIPISVSLLGMVTPIEVETIGGGNSERGCSSESESYDSQKYKYNWKCWTNKQTDSFEYTFKGTKFGIYGTCKTNQCSFSVSLDQQKIAEVNPKETNQNSETKTAYESKRLEYGTHTIHVQMTSGTIIIHKFVYWPSTYAKRLSATKTDNPGPSDLQNSGWPIINQ